MSISGTLAASSRIAVAPGVQRLSPARLRNRPVAVWVRGSMRKAGPSIVASQRGSGRAGRRQRRPVAAGSRGGTNVTPDDSGEVLVHRIKSVRLQRGEAAAEFL